MIVLRGGKENRHLGCLRTVFVQSKALCSLGFMIKAVITFSNKLFKCIQRIVNHEALKVYLLISQRSYTVEQADREADIEDKGIHSLSNVQI